MLVCKRDLMVKGDGESMVSEGAKASRGSKTPNSCYQSMAGLVAEDKRGSLLSTKEARRKGKNLQTTPSHVLCFSFSSPAHLPCLGVVRTALPDPGWSLIPCCWAIALPIITKDYEHAARMTLFTFPFSVFYNKPIQPSHFLTYGCYGES